MNPLNRFLGSLLVTAATLIASASAQDAAPSAKNLAANLSESIRDGNSEIRLKMEIPPSNGKAKTVLQLRVRSRRTKSATETLYQVLWPRDRKGEGFLLKRSGTRAPTGTYFSPPSSMVTLTSTKMKEGIFGSDLSFMDLVEDFYAWNSQKIIGSENVGKIPCVILESRPGGSAQSPYAKVLSWIDTKRMVPLRVDKYYGGGKLARRVETTRVSKANANRLIPSSFSVFGPGQGSPTIIEGSSSKHNMTFSDGDFSKDALRVLK